ncbi:MAG TPA: galactokinase [Vicinamibacterales bacterium]|nr:galactokinase [Vicinamibacterales bacterium]
MIDRLAARFRERFGCDARIYRAPGRVNLIGEHTDYNEGFVLPAALNLATWVAASPRTDGRLVAQSEHLGDSREWDLREAEPSPARHWSDYIAGVAVMLQRAGYPVEGATLLIASDVPIGSGLSSSAALEVATALALLDLAGRDIDRTELAKICQRAEIEFVGARVGIMDQFIACHGVAGAAVLLDCRSLDFRAVPIPGDVRLVACNSMVRHGHAGGEYNRRREECERGVALLRAREPGVRSLRDVTLAMLEKHRTALPDVIFCRCRHVVAENGRVEATVAALEQGRLDAIGPLMADSHSSLREDYEVSCPELDLLVELASAVPGVCGARMTGGGFGGCTVNLVPAGMVDTFHERVAAAYEARTGRRPEIYPSEAGPGASRVQ